MKFSLFLIISLLALGVWAGYLFWRDYRTSIELTDEEAEMVRRIIDTGGAR